MPFDVLHFIQDYNISNKDSGPNCAPGWININCPMCPHGDNLFHLGFDISSGYCNCWRCHAKDIMQIIAVLLHINYKSAKQVFSQYYISKEAGRSRQSNFFIKKAKKRNPNIKEVKFPLGTEKMKEVHKKYLESRNFDPEYIENKYGVLGTSHIGFYKHRLIIPIYMNRILISYQSRDISGKSSKKHKACNENEELVHYKNSLYEIDNANKFKVIITEGIMDQWRLGDDCISSYGVGWTLEQLLIIKRKYKKVFILYDPDGAGMSAADELAEALLMLGVKVEAYELDPGIDPADLSDADALYLKRDILTDIYC